MFAGAVVRLIDLVEKPPYTQEIITVMKAHALLIDGRLERFDGTLAEAEDKIDGYTSEGMAAVYLLGADSEEEFVCRWEEERRRMATRTM